MSAFSNNLDLLRFELRLDNGLAFASYKLTENTLFIRHVEADPNLRGTGAAGDLMEHIMQYAREHDHKIFPICSYAVNWMNRHQEYQTLLLR